MKKLSKAAIKKSMKKFVEECRDKKTLEINYTLLAEQTANDLNYYENEIDYTIPEEVFEIAVEFD